MKFEERFPKTLKLLEAARTGNDAVFPAYAAGVALGDADRPHVYIHASGCGEESLFDLASLTKVLCTTTLCLIAEKKKLIALSDPVQKYFPEFRSSKPTLSHLLNHSSGLPAYLELHSEFHKPDSRGGFDGLVTPIAARVRFEERILESWVEKDFERECLYSDLGFMLLGWLLENITDTPLDALFQEWVAKPCKLRNLQFLPASPDVVPTEDCPWRGHALRGEVHDDNCYVLGGVTGHAGLFGDIHDVLRLAGIWLAGKKPLTKALVQKYWETAHAPGVRVLGWDGPTRPTQPERLGSTAPAVSSSGHFFSQDARGHLGFTGTSLWIEPQRKLIVSLLTNRVHPTRRNEAIKKFRPEFHDSLMRELGFDRP